MQASKLLFITLAIFAMFCAPASVVAQTASSTITTSSQFSREGVFGCNQDGAYAMSVGTINTVTSGGGTYVPVNDSAVTSNTAGTLLDVGTLVYKECVLREIVDRMAESALSSFQKRDLLSFETSRNGGPMYPRNLNQDILQRNDDVIVRQLTNGSLDTLNPAFASQIKRTILRGYQASTRSRSKGLACPYQGDLTALQQSQPDSFSFEGLLAEGNPVCNPLFAYEIAREQVYDNVSSDASEMMTRLGWSNGIYGVESTDDQGNRITKTPGILVKDVTSQALNAGYQRLINANDVGQMVGALFAGLGTQIMSSSGGLEGATQSVGSQPSYLDQLVKESSNGLVSSAVNAALQILSAARQVEAQFQQIMNSIANTLTSTIQQIKGGENQCWVLLIQHVCASDISTSSSPMTCRDVDGNKLKIATTTVASQAIINAQIAPLGSTTIDNLAASEKALSLIDNLITGVTNTTSSDAVRVALQQLDTLVAQHALHTQPDLSAAQTQMNAVQTNMAALLQSTAASWGDSMDPNIGWCNFNNPAVIQFWAQRWKQ